MLRHKEKLSASVFPDPCRTLVRNHMLRRREKLSKLYFDINNRITRMSTCLETAEDYPAEVSHEEAEGVRMFLKEAGVTMEDAFELFIGMTER